MTIQPTGSPSERLGQFFDFIWGEQVGWVYLPTKSKTNEWKKRYYKWPDHKKVIVQYVLTSAADNDVYYGPAIYKPEVESKLKDKQQTNKEDILGSYVVWADFDGNAPEQWTPVPLGAPQGQPGSAERPSLPAPSLRVQSSTEANQHCYWRLDEFCTDIDFLETTNRGIAYLASADTSGWDINQILRPIESINHKPHLVDRAVIVYDESGDFYSRGTFSGFEPVKNYIKDNLELAELPTVQEILGKYTWAADDLALINKTKADIEANPRDRSNALMRIGYTCAEMQLTDEEAFSLLSYLDDKWEKYKHRNDRIQRLIDIINRARQKYPHGREQPTFAGLTSDSTEVTVSERLVYGFRDLLEAEVHHEWMIDDLIPIGGLGLIASAPNVGKTQVTLGMSMACATGRSFMTYKPTKMHKTMFFSLEMNLPSLKSFLATMAPAYTPEEQELLQRNCLLVPHGMSINLSLKESQKGFESLIEEYKPDGIYIDSLQKVYLGKLNDDEIRGLYSYLQTVRQRYGVYIIQIHHDRKAQERGRKPGDLSDIYGSTYITAEPDFVVHLWKPGGPTSNLVEVRQLKNRLAPVAEMFDVVRTDHLQFRPATDDDRKPVGMVGNGLSGNPHGATHSSGFGVV